MKFFEEVSVRGTLNTSDSLLQQLIEKQYKILSHSPTTLKRRNRRLLSKNTNKTISTPPPRASGCVNLGIGLQPESGYTVYPIIEDRDQRKKITGRE